MKKQSIVIMAVLLLALSMVSAATTFVTPGAAAVIRGNYVVNITSSDLATTSNCSFTATSALTGDSLAATVAKKAGAASTWANATIASAALEDASDWVFAGTCYNATASATITSRTGITVDNTVPVAPSSLSPTSTQDENNVGPFSATVTGARTTACTLTVTTQLLGAQTYTMTHSGNTCTYGYLTLPGQEVATYTVTASDGLNSTISSSASITTNKAATSWSPSSTDTADGAADGGVSFGKLLIFGAVAAGAYYLLSDGKASKSRRRR